MLNQHLIAKTSPVARQENIVRWKNYRVTVLGDRLFRVEKNEEKVFRDDATQSVWFRDALPQVFSVVDEGDACVISTANCKLILRERREDCRVEFNGKTLPIENEGNLKGTYRTLDVCDGNVYCNGIWTGGKDYEIELGNGVCSKSGVAVLDDAESLTLGQDGEVKPVRASGTDEYVFAFGDDYRGAVRALYQITGNPPLIPRFALGNWWSRYYVYTDKEYLRVLHRFEEENVPLSVATIDMDWHWSTEMESDLHITELGRNTEFYGGNDGWTGYSWNTRLFPNYRKFLKEIERKNLKITLNLHPADGFRWWEDCYEEMANAIGMSALSGEKIPFDIANPTFINAYFSIAHKPYEQDGVAFWWIDWQQGTNSQMEGLDPLWSLNHYHYLDNALNHDTPLILSRYSGVGSHRYPLGFSGDTLMTWKTLAYLPVFTATASNVGYTWWSHDIGGHMLGEKDDEMYVRHLQYGVFSPINRLHCSSSEILTKEPSAYGNGAGAIAKDWLRLRHAFIPYLYTASYENHADGKALVEPLYYEWKQAEAYEFATEYRFGSQLLVFPVTAPRAKDGFARVKAWIPQGVWTDLFTGIEYRAGKHGVKKTMLRQLESIPVLVKAGGILPLSEESGFGADNPKTLKVLAFEGDGEYAMYEDGANKGKKGKLVTYFQMQQVVVGDKCLQRLTIMAIGAQGIAPAKRCMKVRFQNLPLQSKICLYVDGVKKRCKEVLVDCPAVDLSFEQGKLYDITVEYQPLTRLEKWLAAARRILTQANGNVLQKKEAYAAVCECKTEEQFRAFVSSYKGISAAVRAALKEVL